jgi:hypothetical protein
MTPRKTWFVFAAGLSAGLAVATAFFSVGSMPRASAQGPQLPAPRFVMSTWAYPGTATTAGHHGAYVLDTATGKVWESDDGQNLHERGQAN